MLSRLEGVHEVPRTAVGLGEEHGRYDWTQRVRYERAPPKEDPRQLPQARCARPLLECWRMISSWLHSVYVNEEFFPQATGSK